MALVPICGPTGQVSGELRTGYLTPIYPPESREAAGRFDGEFCFDFLRFGDRRCTGSQMRFGLEWGTNQGAGITGAGLIARRTGALWDASRVPFGYPLSLVATAPHESHYRTTGGIKCVGNCPEARPAAMQRLLNQRQPALGPRQRLHPRVHLVSRSASGPGAWSCPSTSSTATCSARQSERTEQSTELAQTGIWPAWLVAETGSGRNGRPARRSRPR